MPIIPPSNKYSGASEINNKGQVVGYATFPGGPNRAVLWENGVMRELGTLGGNESWASDINDQGQVVGSAQINSIDFHAFLWESGTMTDLGAIGGNGSNGYGNIAYAINNREQVVGLASVAQASSGGSHAFIWQKGVMQDLNSLLPANSGWELLLAEDINNNGQIVGAGYVSGQFHAFLLTPTWVIN